MNIYFAPMEGITGYVFRNSYAACYGGIDAFYTPFISNPSLNQIELHDVLPENNRGIRLIPQVLTNRVDYFVTIAKKLKYFGYDEVNLNLGCPSGTVVAKNRGSGLLREPKELDKLLYEIFEASPLPVSVKCRIGISSEVEWEDILEVLLKYPTAELIIHPRLQKDFYKGDVHREAFDFAYHRIKEYSIDGVSGSSGKDFRLCYNGDIRTPEDFRALIRDYPGIDSVMLGRGLLWNPELAEQITRSIGGGSSATGSFASLRMTGYEDSSGLNETSLDTGSFASLRMTGYEDSSGLNETSLDPGSFASLRMTGYEDSSGLTAAPDSVPSPGKSASPDIPRLRRFLDLLYENYRAEMSREGPALMKLKELWSYLALYIQKTPQEMRPLWKTKTLAEYKDVVNMLLSR